MAKVEMDGLGELTLSLKEIADLPDAVIDEMLNAQADIAAAAQQEEATRMLVGPYATGTTAMTVRKGKVKIKNGQRVIYVTPTGTRKRGKTVTRNAEIAFLNEYGTRKIPARPFIRTANERTAVEQEKAAMKIYDDYLKSKGL